MTTTIQWRCASSDPPTERRVVLITDGERVAKAEWVSGGWPNQEIIAGGIAWDASGRNTVGITPTHWVPVGELMPHDDS